MNHIILGKGEVAGAVASNLLKEKIIFYDKFPGGHCLRPNIHLHSDRISKFLDQYEKE